LTESDDELLLRCRHGHESAWQELVARHTRRVFNIAYRFTGRVEEAEDLTQEIFVKVYRNLERYQVGDGAFPAWIGTVARNLAIDRYRRRRDERLNDDPELLALLPASGAGPLRAIEQAEVVHLVHSGLRALPKELREVLVLCELQEASYDEAARALSIPLGTVKSRLNRGRLELAKRLLRRRQGLDAAPREA
jgi:RNA polymerase sigma-70 factor (ECF subfamily)